MSDCFTPHPRICAVPGPARAGSQLALAGDLMWQIDPRYQDHWLGWRVYLVLGLMNVLTVGALVCAALIVSLLIH